MIRDNENVWNWILSRSAGIVCNIYLKNVSCVDEIECLLFYSFIFKEIIEYNFIKKLYNYL